MFLISSSSMGILSWYFLKIKTPVSARGDRWIFLLRALYPRLLSKFLLTANLTIFLGAIKEIFVFPSSFFKQRKDRLGELKDLPSLKILSTSLVLTLFFLGNIVKKLNSELFSAFLASPF